jgi:integrase/recombinase XerD
VKPGPKPRTRAQRERPLTPVPDDPMHMMLEQHLAWMQVQNFSPDTVATRRASIGYFIDWCRERGVAEPAEVTRTVLERYHRALYHHRKQNGQPLTFRTQHMRLRALKGWFRWMTRQNLLLHNPASELALPKLGNRLRRVVRAQSTDSPGARLPE